MKKKKVERYYLSSSRLAVVAIQVHAGTGARLYLSALPTHYLATTLRASHVTEGKLRLRGKCFARLVIRRGRIRTQVGRRM